MRNRTIVLALAVALFGVLSATASLPPSEGLTGDPFRWSDADEPDVKSPPACSLPQFPTTAFRDVTIKKSGRVLID